MKVTPKIAILAPTFRGYGGLEKYTLDLLLAITERYPVTLISSHYVNPEAIASNFGKSIPLSQVHFLVEPGCLMKPGNRIQRWLQTRAQANLTAPFDILFMSTWLTPMLQRAKRGVLICHFPGEGRKLEVANPLSSAFREQRDFHQRLSSWDAILTSSHFGQKWLKQYWQRDSQVLYPGIDLSAELFPAESDKKPWILGCGFFSQPVPGEQYSYKRQEVLIEAFRRLKEKPETSALELHLAGHVSKDAAGNSILERLRGLANDLPVVFHANCSVAELQGLYQSSSLFWHATGFDIDSEKQPFRLEHFGMVTVEAMSRRCVPVVYGQGGQREIVQDGDSGFWWFGLDELVQKSLEVLNTPGRAATMGEQARRRALEFSETNFRGNALAILEAEIAKLG